MRQPDGGLVNRMRQPVPVIAINQIVMGREATSRIPGAVSGVGVFAV